MLAALLAPALGAAATPAFGATYTVNPSQSTAAIQGVISGAASGADTVVFSAGTYNLTAQLTLNCGVTYTGPVTTPATAILNGSGASIGASNGIFTLYSNANVSNPCTQATTIEYLDFQAGTTGIFVQTSFTNLNILHNQFTSIPGYETQSAAMVFQSGNTTSNTAATLTNTTIDHNQIGDTNSCISPTNVMADVDSPEDYNGACNGLVFFTSINGLAVTNNTFLHVSEGTHINCPNYANQALPCEPPGGALTENMTVEFNDFNQIHRIAWEEQPQQTANINYQYNSEHDWVNAYFGSFGVSFACCYNGTIAQPNFNGSNNVILFNTTPTPNGDGFTLRYGYGMEAMGNAATYDNELVETTNYSPCTNGCGAPAPGMTYGRGPVAHMDNNTVCGGAFAQAGSGYIVTEGLGDLDDTPTLVGNNTAAACAAVTSVAPAISPAPGSYTSPLTVTLTDAGYASGPQPLGNTSIWYTVDGSSPRPGGGTSKLYTAPFALTLPATVNAIGMWGTGGNALTYPAGYGFVPSAVQAAAYSTGGGVTLSSVSVSATAGATTLNVGQTVPMIATCNYSDGSMTGCNTVDAHGVEVTSWSSSGGAVTVNAAGLATGAAIGTAGITATVTGGVTNGTPYDLTVSALPLTLSSVTLATAGGVSTIAAGATNQLIATCGYSDGSSDLCGAAVDAHGNQVNSWTSSAPTIALMNGSGNVTGAGAGSTNLSASVTPAPGQLGTNLYNTAGFTNSGYINYTYAVTGTATFTPGTCTIYMQGAQAVGSFWDCLLTLAPTPTTQAASALCSARYTVTASTPANANVSFAITGCGSLPPDTAYWVGSATNQAASPGQGFNNCGGSCTGGVPTEGSGTYPYRYVANPFGVYTGMSPALLASAAMQPSQYVTVTALPVSSSALTLMVTAAPPALSSAYLTGSTSSLTVGGTAQMAAKCVYTNPAATTDCTVADIYGNAVSSWVSSDAAEATVGAVGSATAGLVTAVAAGTPGITAAINGGIRSSAYSVTVTSPAVALTGVSLATTGGVTGVFAGSTNQLIAKCSYSDGSTTNCTTTDSHGNVASHYTSSVPAHATVNATSGLVTGIAAGATTLTAMAGSFTSTGIPLTVLAIPTGNYTITITGPVRFSGVVRF
jgi:Chitobiase/beta-hexosaminidase C-terminal domain